MASGRFQSFSMSSWKGDGLDLSTNAINLLASDFEGSLSGLGSDLSIQHYNMSEALMALPVYKQPNLENGFQYILGAATSPATKVNEETLTYLNQGQSYEIKLKKLGDLSEIQGKFLKSIVRICFHDRRLQFAETEQFADWKKQRPGERILVVDVPLSYGLFDMKINDQSLNRAEFIWDPTKETGIFIQVNCISTEFTAKKHGGEKGVPFRIQIDTYLQNDEEPAHHLHSASCQIKVFKPKGADRKHKTDREKMEKRSATEQVKYQPSYECTVLTECQPDNMFMSATNFKKGGEDSQQNEQQTQTQSSTIPITTYAGGDWRNSPAPNASLYSHGSGCSSPVESDAMQDSPGSLAANGDLPFLDVLSPESNAVQTASWLKRNRFGNYVHVFSNFSGADLLRLNREDLIQICGLADGIRLNNALQARHVRPRLTIYVCQEAEHVYHAVYLEMATLEELQQKCAELYHVSVSQIVDIYVTGPSGIHVLVSNEVVQNFQEESRFAIEMLKDDNTDALRVILKAMS